MPINPIFGFVGVAGKLRRLASTENSTNKSFGLISWWEVMQMEYIICFTLLVMIILFIIKKIIAQQPTKRN